MKIDEDIKKFVKFLDNNKHYVGLSEWKIFVAIEPTEGKDALAEVDADIYEKTLKISLSESFMNSDKEKQANILFHELVHGKFEIYKKQLEEHIDILEEHMVNDLVRGFEKYVKFKFN